MRAGWAMMSVVVMWTGCGPASRDGEDASTPDAGSLCGNGHVDPDQHPWPEQCDEGSLNGTPEGHCTKQCQPPQGTQGPYDRTLDMGPPITDVALLTVPSGAFSVATFSRDEGQVRVWKGDDSDPLRLLRVGAPVVSLGSVPILGGPAWIEQAPGASAHLYVADYFASDPPTIRELPYPFPEGIKPELVGHTAADRGVVIVDQSPAGELLVAMVLVRSPTDVATTTLRVPAPPGTRGITVDTNHYWDWDDGRDQEGSRQLVVFYDDPGSFVTVDVHFTHYPDALAQLGPLELTEVARGSWPFHVLAGDRKVKACPSWPRSRRVISVLTDTGDIYVWKFDHGVEAGETFPTVFAHVPPGTRASRLGYGEGSITALAADGTMFQFSDGDPCDMSSQGLAPSMVAFTPPSTSMVLPPGDAVSTTIGAIAGGVIFY